MTKTRDKVYDTAENIKPYVERAMTDDRLRGELMRAFGTAREPFLRNRERGKDVAARAAARDEQLQRCAYLADGDRCGRPSVNARLA